MVVAAMGPILDAVDAGVAVVIEEAGMIVVVIREAGMIVVIILPARRHGMARELLNKALTLLLVLPSTLLPLLRTNSRPMVELLLPLTTISKLLIIPPPTVVPTLTRLPLRLILLSMLPSMLLSLMPILLRRISSLVAAILLRMPLPLLLPRPSRLALDPVAKSMELIPTAELLALTVLPCPSLLSPATWCSVPVAWLNPAVVLRLSRPPAQPSLRI